MSNRDQNLVRSLGLSVAQVAEILDKSRQTVTRGIGQPRDYFKPNDLAKALDYWRASDAALFAIAKTKVCEFYPEIADAVLGAIGAANSAVFSTSVPGEYWFLCGDFPGFRTNLPTCAQQIDQLCELDSAQVVLFVNNNKPEKKFVERWRKKYEGNLTLAIYCEKDLRLVPSTLLRIDHDQDNLDLFGAADGGFVGLSRQEAARLRMAIQDIFEDAGADVLKDSGVDRKDANHPRRR